MVYGSSNRLDYPTCKVIETDVYIIINGVTYDKKTLAKLNITPLEVGFYNIADHNKNLGLSICHSIKPLDGYVYTYWYGTSYEHEVPTHRTSIPDSQNNYIEWTIHGDGVIKYDTTKKTYNVYRLTEKVFGELPIYESFYLYQDNEWIYIGCHAGKKTSTIFKLKTVVFNKISGEAKFADDIVTGSYTSCVNILKRDANSVYIIISDLGTTYIKKLTCASGAISVNNIDKTNIPDPGTYCTSFPSKLIDNEYFYRLSSGNKLGYYRLIPGDVIEKVEEESLLDEVKIKSKDYIKNKFSIQDDQWDTEKTNYLTMLATQVVGYRQWRCYTMGDNNEYLVVTNVATTETKPTNSTNQGKTEIIMVYKRNNPDTDPLDLTLVDYKTKNELYYSSYGLGAILKLNPKTLYSWGEFGIMILDLQSDGILKPKYFYNSKLASFGFDQLGRLYTANKDNNVVEVFTDKLPYDLEIKYENTSDAYIPFDKNPVTKNIVVTSKNIWGKPVMASFELGCTGNSEFTQSASNTYRGSTNDTGTATVSLKIKGPTTATVGKKLLYNNELQFADVSNPVT